MTERDDLISWLKDAYAMEVSITEVLENHVKDARDFPEMETRLREHLEETRRHADRVKACVESLGSSTSKAKTLMSDIMGRVKAVSTGMAEDEIVKNTLSEYMTEHFEIGCYRSLIAAAEELGETRVAQVCREILEEERRMADWVYDQIPSITVRHMSVHAT